jgi:predicted HD superfamily hydrolase involved in NAD metabolism
MRERVLTWLAERVPPSRLTHILGVEAMARALAEHYHLNAQQAAVAGLMHDLAKNFPPDRLLALARAARVEIDSVQAENPHLLHADASAIVAQTEFGIDDPAILDAIRHHTLGAPGMSSLSCVVFVADALEPSRGDSEVLSTLRATAWQHLETSVWQTSDYSLQYLLAKQGVIHPRTVLTRNWALQQAKLARKKASREDHSQ